MATPLQTRSERPEPTGDARHDAYLGALAEHLAFRRRGIFVPERSLHRV